MHPRLHARERFERATRPRTNPFAFPAGWVDSLSVRRRDGSLRHRIGLQNQAFKKAVDKMIAEAEAGTYRCPRCGSLRPTLTKEVGFWSPLCDVCAPFDEDDE